MTTRLPAKWLCYGDVIYVVIGSTREEFAFPFTVKCVRDTGNNTVTLMLSRWLSYYGETIHTELNVSANDMFTVVK